MDAPELTSEGRTIGTPAFMSPEQCAGNEEIDGRSDVYGLGAVLYRCLVGKTPYAGSTTQMLYAHVYEPLLIPEEMVVLLPPIVVATLQRAMMKDPAHRYQAASEIAQDLALASGKLPGGDERAPSSSTVTMPALDVVRRDEQTAPARVLVPVIGPVQTRAQPLSPERRRTTVKREEAVAPLRANPSREGPARAATNARRTRRAWSRSMGMVTLMALLVVAGLSAFALTFLDDVPGSMAALVGRQGTPTPFAGAVAGEEGAGAGGDPDGESVAIDGDTPIGAAQPDDAGAVEAPISAMPPEARDPAQSGTDIVVDDGVTDDSVTEGTADSVADAVVVTTTVPVTGTPLPPDVTLPSAWQDALDAFDAEEWLAARTQLLIVRQLDPEHEAALVEAMLAAVNVELAEVAYEAGELLLAVELLQEAEQADPRLNARLEEAFAASQANDEDGEAVEELRAALADVADELFAADASCSAMLYGNIAVALGNDASEGVTGSSWLASLVEACEAQREPELPTLEGRLIYSSQEGDVHRIFAMPVTAPGNSTLLVDNAAQPRLRGDGRMIAFYSWQRGQTGLAGLDVLMGQNPANRSLYFTEHSEDSRDSQPTWSPTGDRLAYSSTSFGDGRYRIYVAQADGSRQVTELGYGKDPAWHPWQDWLVFNGVDTGGEQPGLWLMHSDGSERRRLTDNGNDQRPVWTPDGRSIVFMSSGRHDNWELYRLNFEDLSIMRLTYSGAQDGLPAVSPDGNFVAFVSDRDGLWNFWYMPILGGDAVRLGSMSGQMVSWLEHGVQWVR
jgi:eukaryotic-like serine/threonine-protein kinase